MPAFNRLLPLASLMLVYWGKYSTLPCNMQVTGIMITIITLNWCHWWEKEACLASFCVCLPDMGVHMCSQKAGIWGCKGTSPTALWLDIPPPPIFFGASSSLTPFLIIPMSSPSLPLCWKECILIHYFKILACVYIALLSEDSVLNISVGWGHISFYLKKNNKAQKLDAWILERKYRSSRIC